MIEMLCDGVLDMSVNGLHKFHFYFICLIGKRKG